MPNILNNLGKTFISQSLSAPQQSGKIVINLKMLPTSLYFVYLHGANGTVVKKFVKE